MEHRANCVILIGFVGNPPPGWFVGNPEAIHFIRYSACPATGLLRSSRGLLAAILPLFPRRLQLPIPLGLDLLLMPGEHVLWRDVAYRTVQADVVVMLHVTLRQTKRIIQGKRCTRLDTFAF